MQIKRGKGGVLHAVGKGLLRRDMESHVHEHVPAQFGVSGEVEGSDKAASRLREAHEHVRRDLRERAEVHPQPELPVEHELLPGLGDLL